MERQKITLRSSDNESFEVDKKVAMKSQTISFLIEDSCFDDGVTLSNVNAKILSKVIEYCKKHTDAAAVADASAEAEAEAAAASNSTDDLAIEPAEDEIKNWDADFMKVDLATLFDLILAANYLNIQELLDLTCQTVADMIKGKSPEEIRNIFNIKSDLTPEEEEQARRENLWAYD